MLKSLARELQVPIIALSQLNRRAESRQYPLLSDLRGPNAIEDDADVVMLLYREDMYRDHTPRQGMADISIVKHRNGPTRTVWTHFHPEVCFCSRRSDEHSADPVPFAYSRSECWSGTGGGAMSGHE